MTDIKFGTDGWRALIAKDFTTENVARIATATAKWLIGKYRDPVAVIGHDTRFAGPLFAETVARVFAFHGIRVKMAPAFVSTPMVSLAVVQLKAQLGVVITASHNPAGYSGYKLKGAYGGPLLDKDLHSIERLVAASNDINLDLLRLNDFIAARKIEIVDLEKIYLDYLRQKFDLATISNSPFRFAFDAMYGAGQRVIKTLLPDVACLHCDENPTFAGIPPEPLHRNLSEFSEFIKQDGGIACGLAVDGDADRIALYDSEGNYIDSHHIILILTWYLARYKGLKGDIATGFSTTVKLDTLCNHLGLKVHRAKIGFKNLCEFILAGNILVAGEESGGITISTHIPERDGIFMGLTIWQFMVETGKSLRQIIDEIYEITGSFAFERNDLHIEPSLKQRIVENCQRQEFKAFGPYQVQRVETLDGFKFFFNDSEWVMIRPSGTEPVLRNYAESQTRESALHILEETWKTISQV
jgi:phosphomannomutase